MASGTSSPALLNAAFSGSDAAPAEVSLQRAAEPAARERLAKLLRDEFRSVWRLVRRFGVPSASADDAAQEVFIIAARRLHEIEIGRERRYLFGIAIRVAANARRALAKRPEQADSDALVDAQSQIPPSDALLDQKRMRELSDSVLDAMTLELRTAFVLFELEGFSVPEIAELLEIPTGTVASRLRRAREIFQKTVAHLKTAPRAPRGNP
jgi:RNA polymerase sigma-70 factor (ECF subfamily)